MIAVVWRGCRSIATGQPIRGSSRHLIWPTSPMRSKKETGTTYSAWYHPITLDKLIFFVYYIVNGYTISTADIEEIQVNG
jgi:hypothetical protein